MRSETFYPAPQIDPSAPFTMLNVPYSMQYQMQALGCDNREAFRRRVVDAIAAGCRHFVLDLRDARYIDSSGLGVLVACSRRARAVNGSFVILGANEDLCTLFELTRLDTVLTIKSVVQWIADGYPEPPRRGEESAAS